MLVATIIAAAIAFVGAVLGARVVMAAGLMDAPTAVRKVHRAPTPTAGGLGIAFAFALALAAALHPMSGLLVGAIEPGAAADLAGCVAAAFALLVIGVIDDAWPLSPRRKFALMMTVAFTFTALAARADGLSIAPGLAVPLPTVLAIAGSALFYFTLVNAVNFMDGANGLAIGSTAIGVAGLGAIAAAHEAPSLALACATATAAMAGFLVWNFPSGRIFAGDAGSLFCGALAAGLSLVAVQDAGVSVFVPPILFFPMLADVLLTLAWRVGRKRPALRSHRDHLFQIGLRHGLSHRRITLTYWIVAIHCGLVAFLASFGARIDLAQTGALVKAPMFMLAAWVAAFAPLIAWAALALVSIKVSGKLRAFAAKNGLDGE
jgi:Fuc2NAc and GlcNAc transferase